MNNEIKEILEKIIEEKLENLPYTDMLDSKQASELLDYITNLQEQQIQFSSTINELARSNVNLQKRNKELEDGFKATTDEMCEYATRIDKAIEYINKYKYERYCHSPYEKCKYIMREEKEGQDLLNILQGDDKE